MYGNGVQVGAYARYLLALYYKETGDLNRAKKLFTEVVRKYPGSVNHRGVLLSGFIKEEIKSERKYSVTQADKMAAENLTVEGWKLFQQKKMADAEEKFKQAVQKNPTNDRAFQGLGWAQLNQGKKLNAKNSFENCIELNPKNSAAFNGLGWLAHGSNKKDNAIQWWKKAVKVAPGATASLSGMTKVYMERKDYKNAIKYYQMWLKAEPDNEQAKTGLANAKASTGKSSRSAKSPARVTKPGMPRVIRTSPKAFAKNVDPALDKITVKFNQEMRDGSWSWTGGGDTYPERTGQIYYDQDKKTCTMPVKLQPGKVYWVGINSPSHKNFKTPDRTPAKRYVILFATKTADGKPTSIPRDMLAKAKRINR